MSVVARRKVALRLYEGVDAAREYRSLRKTDLIHRFSLAGINGV